jgi:release factor glutamine methyltransferase
MPERTWTVAEILAVTTDFLAKKDPTCPRLEAELLLSSVLKLNRVSLYVNFERVLTPSELSAYRELVKKRGSHEPVAYILGHKEFYKLKLKVNSGTLIPRPETEHLVDEALRLLKEAKKEAKEEDIEDSKSADETQSEVKDEATESKEEKLVADIGTGSGAIALALLSADPNLKVTATDISPKALEVAKENAKICKVEDRVTFLEGHLTAPLIGQKFDLICANLPYIPDADMATLSPDVSLFEPHLALRGGADGLELIQELFSQVKPFLKDGASLILEIWPDTVPKLQQLALAAGLDPKEPILDYSKKTRIFVAINRPPQSQTSLNDSD